MIELRWEIDECLKDLDVFLNDVADACFQVEGIENVGFSVTVVDDARIQEINRSMRKIDAPTDVLSFPMIRYPKGTTAKDNSKLVHREYDPELGYAYLGDCILNLDRAKKQAEEFGHSLKRELGYLTAHSAFHLMGYDHMTEPEKREMREMEKRAMRALRLWKDERCGSVSYQEAFDQENLGIQRD